jgi:hypothetical protein
VTIWRWIKEGRFDVQHVGREVLIPKWEVDLLKSRKLNRIARDRSQIINH